MVESLPFAADDMHHTRSAHGSFADLLRELAQHSDYEVRPRVGGWGPGGMPAVQAFWKACLAAMLDFCELRGSHSYLPC